MRPPTVLRSLASASAYRGRVVAGVRDVASRMRTPGIPYSLMEWAGVALLALAAAFIHVAIAIAVVGTYLFASAILAQLTDIEEDKECRK